MAEHWLKTSRQRLGISQEELASQLQIRGFDISRATIGHWEQGKYPPPLENPEFCKALADILLISVRSLLSMAGYDIEEQQHSETAERVAFIVDRLPPDKQQLALKLVEQLQN